MLQKIDELQQRDANIAATTAAQLTSIVHFLGIKHLNPSQKVEFKNPDIFLPFPGLEVTTGESADEVRLKITERTKHVLHRLVQERRIPIHVYMRLSRPPSPSSPRR